MYTPLLEFVSHHLRRGEGAEGEGGSDKTDKMKEVLDVLEDVIVAPFMRDVAGGPETPRGDPLDFIGSSLELSNSLVSGPHLSGPPGLPQTI